MLTLIQAIVFISFVSFLFFKFKGPLISISYSWYNLDGFQKYLFTLFCWGIAIPMLYQSNGSTLFFFISGTGLAFVGASTSFKDNDYLTNFIHLTGAGIAIVFAFIGIGIERHNWIPMIACAISIIVIKLLKIKNPIWWIEISAFLFIIIGLFIK